MKQPKEPVAGVYASYPVEMREKTLDLRKIVMDLAASNDDVGPIEETLKWGEPSYVARQGSAIRIAWKHKSPDSYALYFNCNTSLVDTFREVYPDTFNYEGNRAIVFHRDERLNRAALEQCVLLAFRYHTIKHLPLLGV